MVSDKLKDFAAKVQHLTYQLVKCYEQCDHECVAQLGVTAAQGYTVLSLPQDGATSMNELSKAMGVDNSTMTRMVDQLARKGLVHRRPDDSDRRLVRVGLTEKGRELHIGLEQELQSFYQQALNDIPETELQAIVDGLERLNQAFAKAVEACGAGCGASEFLSRVLKGRPRQK